MGHEYFHNWTGNRVTCRDWFQLTLKEGLTVFRDSEFTSDLNSRAVKRISDVTMMRTSQFSQDAGPMAHPIRPDSYIKMDNFYTVTVYEKVRPTAGSAKKCTGPCATVLCLMPKAAERAPCGRTRRVPAGLRGGALVRDGSRPRRLSEGSGPLL